MDTPVPAHVQTALEALFGAATPGAEIAPGTTLRQVEHTGGSLELTVERAGKTFVFWLQPSSPDSAFYRRTARFNLGYRGELPDRAALGAVDRLCAQVQEREGSLPREVYEELFPAVL